MRYASAAAFRQAIDDTLRARLGRGADQARARRTIVFERLLSRLVAAGSHRWVLKGGVALEARLADRARATKDLDLAVEALVPDEDAVRALVTEAIAGDPDGDWFRMRLADIRPLAVDEAGRPGWRLSVRADLDAREFATVQVDVVARTDEIASTERIAISSSLAFAELPDIEVEVVDCDQHFAEKLHALTQPWAGRGNTRVKDLIDLVLLVENGLEPSRKLQTTVKHLFDARGTHEVPTLIPDPPFSWQASYAAQAADVRLTAVTIDEAHRVVQEFWVATAEEIV